MTMNICESRISIRQHQHQHRQHREQRQQHQQHQQWQWQQRHENDPPRQTSRIRSRSHSRSRARPLSPQRSSFLAVLISISILLFTATMPTLNTLTNVHVHVHVHAFQPQHSHQMLTRKSTSPHHANLYPHLYKNLHSYTSSLLYSSSSSSSSPSSPSSSSSSRSSSSNISSVAELGKPVELKYTTYYDGEVIENDNENNKSEEDDHEPVILLHGLLGQKRNFASLCKSLSKQLTKKRTIYALDLRNHGDNHHDWRDEMSYSHMCHDVLSFMNTQTPKKTHQNVILIGHSMGGKVAKSLALSYPDRVAGLVVLDIAPVTYDAVTDPAWRAVEGIIHSLSGVNIGRRGMTKRTVDRDLRATVEDPALRAFVLTNLEETVDGGGDNGGDDGGDSTSTSTLQWKININSITTQLDVIAGFDYLRVVDDIDGQSQLNGASSGEGSVNGYNAAKTGSKYEGDTFFINGGTSSFVKGKHMEVISKYFPNYMLTTIRGSGHWVHAEAPDDTVALLKRYLDR